MSAPTRAARALNDPQSSSTTPYTNLFPTRSSTSTPNGGVKSAPSLYLIIFLSILVVLLITAVTVALRAIHLRRRFRSEIQRALARGSMHPWEADELTRRRESEAWGLGRWAAWSGWDGMSGRPVNTGGRQSRQRRPGREKKKLGPKPKLWEVDPVEAKLDGMVEEDSLSLLSPFALQTLPDGCSPAPPDLDRLQPSVPAGSSQSRPQSSSSPFSAESALQVNRAFNPADNPNSTRRERIVLQQELDSSARPQSQVVPADRSSRGDSGSTEMPTSGEALQAGFLILMPERDIETRQTRQLELPEDERSHGPMEFGLWTGMVGRSSPAWSDNDDGDQRPR